MKLQHLRFFVATVDRGGVGKAAEHLRVSQPAVSAGLKALEQELGEPLFARRGSGRGGRPTARALAFHAQAAGILRQCEAARVQFRRKETPSARLCIGVLPTISSRQVAQFSRAFALADPATRLRLREGAPSQLQEWLRGGQIDAAWTVIDAARTSTHLLWREQFVMLAGRTHPLARRRAAVSWSDLDGDNFILRGCCEAPRGRLWPKSLRMRVVARAERDELALRLVAEGFGIAIAPESLAIEGVVARPIRDLDTTRSIGLKWQPGLDRELLNAAIEALTAAAGRNIPLR
jgi:DNA-binding transcriptional LysR family regulator